GQEPADDARRSQGEKRAQQSRSRRGAQEGPQGRGRSEPEPEQGERDGGNGQRGGQGHGDDRAAIEQRCAEEVSERHHPTEDERSESEDAGNQTERAMAAGEPEQE